MKHQSSNLLLSIDVADTETPMDLVLKAVVDEIAVSVEGEMGGVKSLIDNTNMSLDLTADAGLFPLNLMVKLLNHRWQGCCAKAGTKFRGCCVIQVV